MVCSSDGAAWTGGHSNRKFQFLFLCPEIIQKGRFHISKFYFKSIETKHGKYIQNLNTLSAQNTYKTRHSWARNWRCPGPRPSSISSCSLRPYPGTWGHLREPLPGHKVSAQPLLALGLIPVGGPGSHPEHRLQLNSSRWVPTGLGSKLTHTTSKRGSSRSCQLPSPSYTSGFSPVASL